MDILLSRGIFALRTLNMDSATVCKMRAQFRELQIERSTELVYIQSGVQKFTSTPAKLSE